MQAKTSKSGQVSLLPAVSLFSNCGAGDIGFSKAGFDFKVMAELDERRLQICKLNHPNAIGVPGDLRRSWRSVVDEYRLICDKTPPALLSACPPCQGMSSARSDRGKEADADAGSRDERNLLVEVVANVALDLLPLTIVVENVSAFLTRKVRHPDTREPVSAANLLISRLEAKYQAYPLVTDLADYGIPQSRKRSFVTFIRKDQAFLISLSEKAEIPFPVPTHVKKSGTRHISVSDALTRMKLVSLDAKTKELSSSSDPFHSVPVWSPQQYAMVAAIPPNSGASAWDNCRCPGCGVVEVGDDDAECPQCGAALLRPVMQKDDGTYRLINGFRSSSYRRMAADKPASTVTTASGHVGSDNTIHPFENRLLSALECALLQTFPRSFKWGNALEKWGHTNVRCMIGEAVPPRFTKLHGKVLSGLLRNDTKIAALSEMDHRHLSATRKLKASSKTSGVVTIIQKEKT